MKTKRLIALSISLLLVFVLLASQFFVIVEAEHDCSGENCPVCRFLTIVENTLKQLSFAICSVAAFFLLRASVAKLQPILGEILPQTNPVALKVKLSN